MIVFVVFIWAAHSLNPKSGMFDKPDYGDIRLAANDKLIDPKAVENEETLKPEAVKIMEKKELLKNQRNKLAKFLGTKNVSALNNKNMWKKLWKYTMANWDSLAVDGYLGLPMVIRYNFCVFLVLHIPTEAAFPIPVSYTLIIPKKAKEMPELKGFFEKLDQFNAFIKKKSKEQFLIDFTVGKRFNSKKDFDFLLEIPKLITQDPIRVLRWFVDWEVRTKGLVFK